ncbi:MAG TPA: glycosyltransferase family 4 protein [Clostridia bacterium]|nr:glycosyltransferase family 4 protein [Clostridia bacterium]
MKKVLFVATVSQHFFYFHQPCFELFNKWGWEVHVACSGDFPLNFVDERHDIPFSRSPFSVHNIQAYGALKKIIDSNKYDIIHCHTPVGGAITRIAARNSRKSGTRVIYTAHGFHFFKGASFLNWCLYYPIESLLSRDTDCLITINDEDYEIAQKRLHSARVDYIHGVGCDNSRFHKANEEKKREIRRTLGYKDDEFLMIYVAELNKNKNQSMLIKAVKQVRRSYPNVRLLLVGPDNFCGTHREFAKRINAIDGIDFLGTRNDVEYLLNACDIAVASSFREGLPVNIMEAMSCGLPVVATDNRGHRALVNDGTTGFLVDINDYLSMSLKIETLMKEKGLYNLMSENALKAVEPFFKSNVLTELESIYTKYDDVVASTHEKAEVK